MIDETVHPNDIRWRLSQIVTTTAGKVCFDVGGSGQPLVLVHGTPWSSFNWRHVAAALAPRFTVYVYDLPGYGQSDQFDGQDVSLAAQGDVLAQLLAHWGLEQPVVVGHDFGGTTVLRAHLLHDCTYRKMILVDPVALSPWGSSFFRQVRRHASLFAELPETIHRAILTAYVQGATYRPLDDETREGILAPWLGAQGQPAFYRQIAQAEQRYTGEIEPLYASVRCPTLILWGQEDRWIPVRRALDLQQRIPGSRLEILPQAGHLVQEDAPALLVSHVLKFLHEPDVTTGAS